VTADDLNAPLGQGKRKRLLKLPANVPQLLAGALGLFGLAILGWALFGDNPLGGEPVAVVATVKPAGGQSKAEAGGDGREHSRHDGEAGGTLAVAAAVAKLKTTPPPGSKIVTIIDGSSGQSRNIVILGKTSGGLAKAPADQKLLETTRDGEIPKIGADGARPLTLYAHPRAVPPNKKDWPRIAIIVSGLGISASGTADALAKLPAPVSFALTPYGADLEKLAERARALKHEVLLQVPMEPFDFPYNDPGPQTLLTSLGSDQNIDRLHWLMRRFQGYVGIISYMGAKFTTSEQALSPVLRETAKRGLIYVDDGSSPRSVASQLAGSQNLPFTKAEIVIDKVSTPTEIDHALARLELMARERGTAVGLATALPATIARIAAWAQKVESRGFVLMPITMVAVKAKSS
jgi:polysaccharide deacetylase 2 family uncharacterized protein YibQ